VLKHLTTAVTEMVDRLAKSRFPIAVAFGTGTASVPARDPMPPTTPRTGFTDR
jgi:hypothetical protein